MEDKFWYKQHDGLIEEKPKPTDFIRGVGQTLLQHEDRNTIADWTQFLPSGERQRFRFIDVMACFPYDTEVLMEDFTTKRISDIRVGEYVISHMGQKKRVLEVMKRKYDSEMYRIKIMGNYDEILCTPEHPFLTDIGWIPADKLTTDSRVLIPLTDNLIADKTIKEIEKNPEFLWLLGFYLAEGSITIREKKLKIPKRAVNGGGKGNGTVIFSISKKETDFANKIIDIAKRLFNVDFHIYEKKTSKGMSVYGYSDYLAKLLIELGGQYSDKKRINPRLMFLEPKLQLEIFKGWKDGDGYSDNKKETIISCSKELVGQMHRILLRNRIKSCIYKRNAYGIHKEAFDLNIYGDGDNGFKDNYLTRKVSSIEVVKNPKQRDSKSRVKNVYNLEVEDDHSYIVNTVAVHNCVTFSALNCVETQAKWMIKNKLLPEGTYNKLVELGFIVNGEFNASDRFTAKMSGTTEQGNTLTKVWESIRKDGLLPEGDWPANEDFSWNGYYAAIPDELKQKAKEILKLFKFEYELISPITIPVLKAELRHAPLQITTGVCPGWDNPPVPVCGLGASHATMLYKVDSDNGLEDFDQYAPFQKKLNPGYRVYSCLKGVVSPIKPGEVYPFHYTFSNNLYWGQASPEIVALQRILVQDGELRQGDFKSGTYDNVTKEAVFAFQKRYMVASWWELLFVRGRWIGPATRRKLNELYGL
jgi:intein/homing endonuclease